jgi:hypothetical protein
VCACVCVVRDCVAPVVVVVVVVVVMVVAVDDT